MNQATALSANLTFALNDTFIMRADYTILSTPHLPGRKSVRIQSSATRVRMSPCECLSSDQLPIQ